VQVLSRVLRAMGEPKRRISQFHTMEAGSGKPLPSFLAEVTDLLAKSSLLSPWPEPPKRSRSQQAVHEPIHYFLDRHSPGLTFPDAVAQLT
jgi:hypothetical protein